MQGIAHHCREGGSVRVKKIKLMHQMGNELWRFMPNESSGHLVNRLRGQTRRNLPNGMPKCIYGGFYSTLQRNIKCLWVLRNAQRCNVYRKAKMLVE